MKGTKGRKKKIKSLAMLVLAFSLIFSQNATAFAVGNDETQATEIQNEVAVEPDEETSEDTGSTDMETDDSNIDETLQDGDTQSASGEDTSQSDKEAQETQQESENQEETETTGETTADIMTLSENRELTEDVIKNELNGVIDSNAISLDNFTFTTDESPSPESNAIKEQAAGNVTEVESGAVDGLFEDEITVNGNNYVFEGITVGGVDVYHIGTIQIQNETYIYYLTDRVKTNTTVYTVLNANSNKFTVTYSLADRYDISYELRGEDGSKTDSIGDYDIDTIFGIDRITHLDVGANPSSEDDSYTVDVTIPRGYSATVSVYNLDESGDVDGTAVETLKLGEMMEYKKQGTDGATSGGVVNLTDDSPRSVQLSGTITVNNVQSDQRVVLQYKKYDSFTFSAETWVTTANAGGGIDSDGVTSRIRDFGLNIGSETGSSSVAGTFNPGQAVTWTFTGRTIGGSTWLLNYLQINGENLNIPLLGEHATDAVSAETTLSTGTVVTVTAENTNPAVNWGGNGKNTKYTVEITNCYENITISAGNMVSHTHTEFSIDSITGASDVKVFYNNGWKDINRGNREMITSGTVDSLIFQFKHGTGYFLPEITVNDINGNVIENGVTYLRLKEGMDINNFTGDNWSDFFEEVSYSALIQQPDETYFFKFSQDIVSNINTYRQLHVYINMILMDFEAHYDKGVESSGTPQEDDIANLPATDNNNGSYYNVISDNIISISSSIPTDMTGEYVFAGWQIVAVDGGVIKDDDGNPITLMAGSYLNLTEVLHDWLYEGINHPSNQDESAHFTLKATWAKAESMDGLNEIVNYVVTYNLDGENIKSNSFTANKGAGLVFNVYEDEDGTTFTQDIKNILKSDNFTSEDYTVDDKATIILDSVKVTIGASETKYKASDLLQGGVLINGTDGLTSSTVVTVYFKTMIPVEYEFVSGTANMELPEAVVQQLETALTAEKADSEVAYALNGTVNNALRTYSFNSVNADNGTWTFQNWNQNSDTMENRTDTITFTGTWVFNSYSVSYEFASGTDDKELPDEVTALLPTDDNGYADGTEITAVAPSQTSVNVSDGTWTFTGWDENSKTINGGDIKFTGTWVFTEDKEEIPSIDPDEGNPSDDSTQTPDSTNDDISSSSASANAPQTGDSSNIALWTGAFVVAGVLLAVIVLYGRKRKHNR